MWWQLILWVATTVVSYLLRPKAETQKPPGIGTVEAPTADVGREIPVLFGTRDIKGPNVVWFGDVTTKPKKIKNSGKK